MTMKKFITAAVAAGIIMTNGVVFAEGLQRSAPAKPALAQAKVVKNQSKEQVKAKVAVIKANHQTITALKEEIKAKRAGVKEKLKALKKDTDALTEEKVAEVKEKLALLKDDRVELAQTVGDVRVKELELRLHKKSGNIEAALADLDEIAAIQQQRIDVLKKISADLDGLLASL